MFEKYDDLVWHQIRQYRIPKWLDPDDIHQEVWVKLLEHLDTQKSPKSYIGRVVATTVARMANKKRRMLNSTDFPDQEPNESDDGNHYLDMLVPIPKRLPIDDRLDRILPLLEAADRKILTERYVEGLTRKELAVRYKCTREHIQARIRLAVRKAREVWNDEINKEGRA